MATSKKPSPASHVILMCEPGTADIARAAAEQMYGAGHHPGPLLVGDTSSGRALAMAMAQVVHIAAEDIHFLQDLVGASTDLLEVELRPLALEFTLATLVAHNPGVSELARILAQDPKLPELQPGMWRYLPWPPP